MPAWLTALALASLIVAAVCAAVIAADIPAGHRQRMRIMNLVWPITALYAGPLALFAYFAVGRASGRKRVGREDRHSGRGDGPGGHDAKADKSQKPFWQSVAVAATHCGAGCTLGDLAAEWLVFAFPVALFGRRLFGTWAVDFAFAFAFGIAFQYFTIAPMRGLSPGRGLLAALKADALSLTAWQLGMYGWMAVAVFLIFGRELAPTDPVFWFMMQIAMLAGFLTSYPVNWWLLRAGLKEGM